MRYEDLGLIPRNHKFHILVMIFKSCLVHVGKKFLGNVILLDELLKLRIEVLDLPSTEVVALSTQRLCFEKIQIVLAPAFKRMVPVLRQESRRRLNGIVGFFISGAA